MGKEKIFSISGCKQFTFVDIMNGNEISTIKVSTIFCQCQFSSDFIMLINLGYSYLQINLDICLHTLVHVVLERLL